MSEIPINKVLNALTNPKPSGQNKWLCKCPSHNDKSPSLAIKEESDGRVLLYCFAGCSTQEIVESIGLSLSDLFPPDDNFDRSRYQSYAEQRENKERRELDKSIIEIAQNILNSGGKLTDQEQKEFSAAKWRVKNG